MVVDGISGGRIGDGKYFSGGRNGGGQHTESKAGEADELRRGQYEIKEIKKSWRTSSESGTRIAGEEWGGCE